MHSLIGQINFSNQLGNVNNRQNLHRRPLSQQIWSAAACQPYRSLKLTASYSKKIVVNNRKESQ